MSSARDGFDTPSALGGLGFALQVPASLVCTGGLVTQSWTVLTLSLMGSVVGLVLMIAATLLGSKETEDPRGIPFWIGVCYALIALCIAMLLVVLLLLGVGLASLAICFVGASYLVCEVQRMRLSSEWRLMITKRSDDTMMPFTSASFRRRVALACLVVLAAGFLALYGALMGWPVTQVALVMSVATGAATSLHYLLMHAPQYFIRHHTVGEWEEYAFGVGFVCGFMLGGSVLTFAGFVPAVITGAVGGTLLIHQANRQAALMRGGE